MQSHKTCRALHRRVPTMEKMITDKTDKTEEKTHRKTNNTHSSLRSEIRI